MAARENLEMGGIRGDLRHLREDDLPQLNAMVANEQWSIPLADMACHFKMQPRAFYGLFDGEGNLICHILAAKVTEDVINISLLITREDHRRRGIGRHLFQRIIKEHEFKNIILSAVPGAEGFYENCGFKLSNFKANYVIVHRPKPLENMGSLGLIDIVPVSQNNIRKIAEYDKCISGVSRLVYLSEWLFTPDCQSYAAFDQEGKCVGYASFRVTDKYTKLQPLFADSVENASHLIQFYLSKNSPVPLLKLAMINLESKPEFVEALKQFGNFELRAHYESLMFTKEAIEIQSEKIFAVTNSETTNV